MPHSFPKGEMPAEIKWGRPPGLRGTPSSRSFCGCGCLGARRGRPGGRPRTWASAPLFARMSESGKTMRHWAILPAQETNTRPKPEMPAESRLQEDCLPPPQVQNPSRGIVCRIGCHPAPPMVPRPPALGAPRLYWRFPPNPSRKLNLCRTGRLLQEAIRAKAKTGKHFRDFDHHNRVRTSFGTREIIWCSNKICLYRSAAECILRSITLRLWEQ
jgi:hypothetical protein